MTDITKQGLIFKLINTLETLEACGTEKELQQLSHHLISMRILIKALGGKI